MLESENVDGRPLGERVSVPVLRMNDSFFVPHSPDGLSVLHPFVVELCTQHSATGLVFGLREFTALLSLCAIFAGTSSEEETFGVMRDAIACGDMPESWNLHTHDGMRCVARDFILAMNDARLALLEWTKHIVAERRAQQNSGDN